MRSTVGAERSRVVKSSIAASASIWFSACANTPRYIASRYRACSRASSNTLSS